MNDFVVSALKYRPITFENVIGQNSITKTLENAIKQNQLPQALLFCGPRGVGKTTCARILAKKINTNETENKSDDFSYNIFELDAASNNGVDDIRNLIDQVRIPPQTGKYKVYIIDEVHMLSGQAFNAFLKTLEEPPSYAIFILATTEKHKVIPTILSRCQIYDFKKISTNDIQEYLEKIAKSEKIKYEDEAIFLIAKKSDGALRDALSIFDRLVNYTEGNITKKLAYENLNVLDFEIYFKAYEHIINNDITNMLLLLNLVIEKGFDAQHFIDGFSSHLRDLMVSKNSQTHVLLEQNSSISKKYIEQSKIKDLDFILKAIDLSEDCSFRYKTSKNQRLLVEICLMKLCSISQIELKKKITIIPSNSIKNNKDLIKKETKIIKKEKKTLPASNNKEEKSDIPKVNIDKVISGLSISSLRIKKNIKKNKEKEQELKNSKDQSKKFSEEDLRKLWVKYYSNLLDNGEKNLASILQIDQPIIKNNHEIHFTLSNNINKIELEKNKNKLLGFLKEKLKNNLIELIVHVNKEKEKQFIYSTTEKFEKLKAINPSIEKMRKEFKLGL
ncbi:MAG: DNA polymerase III subunit gamma/tau [Flavobacteriaceae bacterium]|jgi:DNA polymerase-3 subunit gamma/tau|nr:DNA polymerase III subunit gamma/tau [Flavobacteriaceae bacterium]MBT6447969.1 DNA polymerase III subunit gamma/tau [Flavobacteriaceae bacterium]MDG1830112.1 DNA polymerase III subunit gamma/tau [Flavobacteriaceae bacterium]